MEFHEELLPLEAQLSNVSPRESIDFRVVLKEQKPRMIDCNVKRNSFGIFDRSQFNAIEVAPSSSF